MARAAGRPLSDDLSAPQALPDLLYPTGSHENDVRSGVRNQIPLTLPATATVLVTNGEDVLTGIFTGRDAVARRPQDLARDRQVPHEY